MKTPGEVMREARAARRTPLTQKDAAAKCGTTQPMIARWEADNALVPTHKIRIVARTYGVKPERLIP